jgi:hypothetical protein
MCFVPLLSYVSVMARINRGIFLASRGPVSAVSHEISENWTIIHKTHTAMLSRGGFNETIRIRGMKIQTSSCQMCQTITTHCFTVFVFVLLTDEVLGPRPKLRGLWSISYPLVGFCHLSTSSKYKDFEVQASTCHRLSIAQFFMATEFLISSRDETCASLCQRIGLEKYRHFIGTTDIHLTLMSWDLRYFTVSSSLDW